MAAESDGGHWAYRPHLDGLRAIAVYLVVAFHAGVGRLAGGFIGVDVFFVLSGYLVTTLLVRELEGPSGRVRFGRFYSRRARRLLPAAAVSLVVTAMVFSSVGSPVELGAAEGGIRAAALYFANWHFIHQAADYFATDIDSSPVLHYWSLSVEEQFYVVWPIILTALYFVCRWLGPHRRRAVQAIVVAMGLSSAAAALALAGDNLNRAYYGTDTRAYQLLAGATLALAPGLFARVRKFVPRPVLSGVGVVLVLTLVGLASAAFSGGAIQRGVLCALVTSALIVSIEAAPGGLGQRLLSMPFLVYLGKISYGTYLWHWLVIVFIDHKFEVSNLSMMLTAAAIGTGLASLSYQILEMPIRSADRLDRVRLAVIGSGLALSLTVGLLIAPVVLNRGGAISSGGASAAGAPSATVSNTKVDPAWQAAFFDFYDSSHCKKGGIKACALNDSGEQKLLLIGDSHALQMASMMTAFGDHNGFHVYASFLQYCPWPRGLSYWGVGPTCPAQQDEVFDEVIPNLDPDVVVLVHRPYDDPSNPHPVVDREAGRVPMDDPRAPKLLAQRVEEVVKDLRAQGITVVLIEPLPVVTPEDNPLKCLSKATYVEECRFVTSTQPGPEAAAMRALASEDPGVISVNFDPEVCPYLPICDPVVDGLVVRIDDNHITKTFAEHLEGPFTRMMIDNGVITG